MPWMSSRMEMPEEWWDKLRSSQELPSWFRRLVKWTESFHFTHMMTQTFRTRLSGWEAQARYLRFLAAHSSQWMLTECLWAVEQHPGGHGAHIHALWRTRYDALRDTLEPASRKITIPLYRLVKAASQRSMGFSRLWPIVDDSSLAAAYCLKYILKGLKALDSERMPGPTDPMEREKLWGLWTPPPT